MPLRRQSCYRHAAGAAALDLLLAVGDVGDDGLYADLGYQYSVPWAGSCRPAPLWLTPGNHDVRDDFAVCREAFVLPGNGVALVRICRCQIVSLNAEGLLTGWLASAAPPPSLEDRFFHEPAYSPDGGHGEEETIRDQYVPILEQHGVDLVVSGHNHFYWRSAPIDGVQYLITGPTGSRTREAGNTPCYSQWVVNGSEAQTFILLDIAGTRLRVQTFDAAGNLRDETALDRTCPFAGRRTGSRRGPGGQRAEARPSGPCSQMFPLCGHAGRRRRQRRLPVLASPDALANPRRGKAGSTLPDVVADKRNNYSHGFAEDGLADVTMIAPPAWCSGVLGRDRQAPTTAARWDSVFLAAALYGSADAGALAAASQCPAGNGDSTSPRIVKSASPLPVVGSPLSSFSPGAGGLRIITVTFNAATSVRPTPPPSARLPAHQQRRLVWRTPAPAPTPLSWCSIACPTMPQWVAYRRHCWENRGVPTGRSSSTIARAR